MTAFGDATVKAVKPSEPLLAETQYWLGFNALCPHCWEAMRLRQADYRCHNCSDRDVCCESGFERLT